MSEKEALTLSDDVVLQLWLQGFEIDFSRYLGAMPFERKSYFKKTKNQITAKRFYTLQTTLKCINEHELFQFNKIHWADFSVTEILRRRMFVLFLIIQKKSQFIGEWKWFGKLQ